MINSVASKSPYNISFCQRALKSSIQIPCIDVVFTDEANAVFAIAERNKLEIENNLSVSRQHFSDFLKREGRITADEFKDIFSNHKSTILKARKMIDESFDVDVMPEDIARIAIRVSDYIKEKWGDVRIISVGTSPAALAEQLALMGNDVIFLPLSNFRKIDDAEENAVVNRNLSIAMNFLKYKGLTNDGKTNLILDFKSSKENSTLDNVYYYISKEFSDIPEEKFQKVSLADLLNEAFEDGSDFEKRRISYFINDISCSCIEEYSNVPHFYIRPEKYISRQEAENTVYPYQKSNTEIYEQFEKFSRPLARAFSLCSIYEIQKKLNNI